MYEVFENFLAIETLHTCHPYDEQRFFLALDKIVRNNDFNSDDMAAYFREKVSVDGKTPWGYDKAIEHYQAAAWAVAGYLKCLDGRTP